VAYGMSQKFSKTNTQSKIYDIQAVTALTTVEFLNRVDKAKFHNADLSVLGSFDGLYLHIQICWGLTEDG
jgi:hypothetical protein